MKTSKPTAEEIAALKSKVDPLLKDWISSKTNRRCPHSLLPSKLAKLINLPTKELERYFDYCIPIGFYGWLSRTKVTIAENVIRAHPDWDDKTIADFAGYDSIDEFVGAYESAYGLSPAWWRYFNLPACKSNYYYTGELYLHLSPLIAAWEESKDYCLSSTSQKQLAQTLGVTVSELELYYRRCHNTTFERRLGELRIQEAKRLILENPKLKTTELTDMVGYRDAFVFSQEFYRITGQLPIEWRKGNVPGYQNSKREYIFDDEGVVEWIRKKGYCTPNLTLKAVARQVGFAEFRFAQYLAQVENKTFAEWISNLRLKEAKRLLKYYSSLTTEQVARRIGISGKTGFYSWFQQNTGMTPDAWRKAHWTAMANTPSKTKRPVIVSLDPTKIKAVQKETLESHSILSDIFVEEDEQLPGNQNGNEATLVELLQTLLSKDKWDKPEFNELCSSRSLLPGFVIEVINDIAYEKVGDIVIDDDGDCLLINTEYGEMLCNS